MMSLLSTCMKMTSKRIKYCELFGAIFAVPEHTEWFKCDESHTHCVCVCQWAGSDNSMRNAFKITEKIGKISKFIYSRKFCSSQSDELILSTPSSCSCLPFRLLAKITLHLINNIWFYIMSISIQITLKNSTENKLSIFPEINFICPAK